MNEFLARASLSQVGEWERDAHRAVASRCAAPLVRFPELRAL
jgi:hypothetical protein